ncbi:MAG: threonine--tRNA ligase [Armatimonadetes bacterium]|nr:threonine--tRNA ligase [Armatimonadota bacterium]
MASAVKELYPNVQLGIGPAIEDGFYYDFLTEKPFTPEDLTKIEKRMRDIVKRKASPFVRDEMSKEEAKRFFDEQGESLKVELIEETPEEEVFSTYTHQTPQGPFIDWCRGPHVPNTKVLKHFKLTKLAAAYWRGDEKRPQLQRIYGTAFFEQEELDDYLKRLEEAEKRDHRRLGRELGLFLISSEVGVGLPLWLPKGAMLRRTLEEFIRTELLKRGYQPVVTPHIAKADLFRTSGHMTAYAESMYPVMDREHEEFVLKPVNCPFHIQIYKSQARSYRDLPLRFAEFGTVYRWEQSGEVGGLTRVRGFTQDDAHLFLMPEQLREEFKRNVELVLLVLNRLNMTYTARVGFRDPNKPDKYVGSSEAWEQSQGALLAAVQELGEEMGMAYTVEEGEAAIYGPKLDFMVKDAIGRQWQLGTVQVDYVLPERFNLEYTGPDGNPHRPVMIHRAPFGSFERFVGVLIEHFAGAFPLWLAPEQVRLLPIADRHQEYARGVAERLKADGFRVEVDERVERTGFKIREAQLHKIPYMLIVGDNEVESGSVSVRARDAGDLGPTPVEDLIARLKQEQD